MTYLPPLNGGRLNASISGNTAGVKTLVSTGNLILAGGNNVTLSQNANSITISGANNPVFSAGMSNIGNTSGTSGTASNQLIFAGGNNITLSQVTGAGGNTLSFSAPAVSSLSATGAVSISVNGGTVSIGAPNQSVQTQNMVSVLGSTGNISFAGGNGVTFGTNGSTISASVATTYAGSNHSHGNPTLNLTNLSGTTGSASNGFTLSLSAAPMFDAGVSNTIAGGTTYGTMATSLTGGLAFYAGSNIGLSQATAAGGHGSITINAANGGVGGGIALANSQTTYTSGTANLVVAGGAMTIASTTGQSYNFSVPGTSSLSGAGAVTITPNGNTVSINVPVQYNQALSGSNGSFTFQTASFTNANGISFYSSNNSAMAASHNGITLQTNQNISLYGIGNTTQNSSTMLNASNLSFNGVGGATVGYNAGAIQISAPTNGVKTPTAVWGDSVNTASVVAGTVTYLRVPYSGTITAWHLVTDASITCVLDVWKAAGTLPTVANTITASAKPSLSGATTGTSSTLTGWSTTVTAGDIFAFKLDSLTGSPKAITLVLTVS